MNVEKYEEWCHYYDPEEKELKLLGGLVDFDNKIILEIGCGTGRLSFKILPYAKELVAIDKEETAIGICESKQRENPFGSKARFMAVDAHLMDFPSSYFDIVIFSWSIYLISDKASVLKKVRNILNERGLVVILQPIAGNFEEVLSDYYANIDTLEQFSTHSTDSLILLDKLFGNYSESTLETFFVFPTLDKTIEMMEFFIQDEDFRSLSEQEKAALKNRLKDFTDDSEQIVMSDIVKVMISKKQINR